MIDLRTFELGPTLHVGMNPTGITANGKKNEVYVVNTASNNISVIDSERMRLSLRLACMRLPTLSMFLPMEREDMLPTRVRPTYR